MNKELVNQALSIPVPDGFRPMSGEELRQAYGNDDPNRRGLWNRESHVIIAVLWKEYPALLRFMLRDLKAVCRKNEQLHSREYAGHDYHCGGFFSQTVGGQPAEGYRFTYSAGGAAQSAETVLVRQGGTVYSITCAGRTENRESDHALFAGILEGISFQ